MDANGGFWLMLEEKPCKCDQYVSHNDSLLSCPTLESRDCEFALNMFLFSLVPLESKGQVSHSVCLSAPHPLKSERCELRDW